MVDSIGVPLVSALSMRQIEKSCADIGLTPEILIENAGHACANAIVQFVQPQSSRIIVLAGPGNNGKDGLATARYLKNFGYCINVFTLENQSKKNNTLQMNLLAACDITAQVDKQQCIDLLKTLNPTDIIVDALFGTGISKPLDEKWTPIICAVNQSLAKKISIDLPSGLAPDFGISVEIPPISLFKDKIVQADITLALELPKIACATTPGSLFSGTIQPVSIGIPVKLYPKNLPILLQSKCLNPLFIPLKQDAHKGKMGHLLIIAGSMGKSGAAHLAIRAAQSVGVGLITALLPKNLFEVMQSVMYGAMSCAYNPDELLKKQSSHRIGLSWSDLTPSCRAVAIGPGLFPHPYLHTAVKAFLSNTHSPCVIDAEALNALSTVSRIKTNSQPIIMTPHPQEAARLLDVPVQNIQHARLFYALQLASKWNATVVLKGSHTIIASNHNLYICPTGNPGMATGGMGDVLTGMIGALLARGYHPVQAAYLGVYWHGLAGDIVSNQSIPHRLIQPEELILQLNHVSQ